MSRRHAHRVNPLAAKLDRLAEPLQPQSQPQSLHSLDVVGAADGTTEVLLLLPDQEPPYSAGLPPIIDKPYIDPQDGVEKGRVRMEFEAAEVLSDEIVERLRATLRKTPKEMTGLHFSESERAEILSLLGIADPESVLRHIRNLVQARIDHGAEQIVLTFTAQQMERVISRCAYGEALQQKLQEYCDYGIDVNVGLR